MVAVLAFHAGKAVVQVTAIEIPVNDLLQIRSPASSGVFSRQKPTWEEAPDIAEMGLITHLLVMGMLVYSSGTPEGQPFIHYGTVTVKDGDEAQRARAKIFWGTHRPEGSLIVW